ncbi:MAG: dihydrodipicolinate synthase family protein [Gammaproteobacteria bacterium]|nr:dihydrodipicolinate synthase family protein [Gammaproteobacteria bacterium]
MSDLIGINLAMQTPMFEDGSIDYTRWQELIDLYIDSGVQGLVLGAGTGQHPYLTQIECNKLYEIGAKRVDGRCNLICQTSALNVDEVLERSRHAEGLGADALMILPPYLEGPEDDNGLYEFYRTVDAAVNTDIIGYNIPQTTGIGISVELFQRLNTLPNFNYIKDSAGDLATHQAYIQTGYKVLNGADPTTVFAFMAGAAGAIWGAANYMPKECVRLYQLVSTGDFNGALDLWESMVPSLLYAWSGNYIAKVKSASRQRGFDGGAVRRPLTPLSADEEKTLAASLEPLG